MIAKHIQTALIGAFCCLIAACSTPRQYEAELPEELLQKEQTEQFKQALQYQLKQRIRLVEIAHPLLIHNVERCGKRTRYSAGVFLHKISEYPKPQLKAVKQLYGSEDQLKVLHVLDTGASSEKLFAGDQILLINKHPVPDTSEAAIDLLKNEMQSGQTLKLQVMRNKQKLEIAIQPDHLCDYPIQLSQSDAVNGYADGSQIIITSGLMRFANKDNQLALIIAHELAHNTLHHIPQRLSNTAWGGLIDIILNTSGIPSPFVAAGLGANLYSQSYETEADLEGLELMYNAGFELEGLELFWRDMAMIHPAIITHNQSTSHPTTVERAIRIRKEIAELTKDSRSIDTTSPPPYEK
ncbi:M48 family metallopeptidase [Neptuniibacter sp.]|uniref:M48 family metallopeptidase n=1 Tax=Neptuniibacter sp. TaxID=1962643 RepID=UPI0026177327|nr:M48 family metallopeptidase [Neptuniibacter sp.]MCP4596104.1 M48 family metalloprotease [Neptuniibacter sp.]